MTFGEAIEKMRRGAFVAREGWNGKKQFIYITEGTTVPKANLRARAISAIKHWDLINHLDTDVDHTQVEIATRIDMINMQGQIVCGWLASQTDMTATDWFVWEYAQNHQEPEHDPD